MEKFEVTILGCGSALPTTRHLGSSQVINIREKLFMVDCAEGTQIQIRKSKLKFSHINHIFISHLHGDHCFGLIGLISTFGLLGRKRTLHIYGPQDIKAVMQPQIDYFCNGMEYAVEFHEVKTSEHTLIYEDASVEIYTIPLRHRVKCCGYLFKEKPTTRHLRPDMIDRYEIPVAYLNGIKNGMDWTLPDGTVIANSQLTTPPDPVRSYAYCSDTMFLPNNAELMKNVTLLYHEATFGEDNIARSKQTCHSTARQAGEMARLANAGQLIIGHFSSRYDDESVLLDEARSVFPNTQLAVENKTIVIR